MGTSKIIIVHSTENTRGSHPFYAELQIVMSTSSRRNACFVCPIHGEVTDRKGTDSRKKFSGILRMTAATQKVQLRQLPQLQWEKNPSWPLYPIYKARMRLHLYKLEFKPKILQQLYRPLSQTNIRQKT